MVMVRLRTRRAHRPLAGLWSAREVVMSGFPWFAAWPLLLAFIVLPAGAALRRRRNSREASDVALGLAAFAADVRRADRRLTMDENLYLRLARLRLAEATPLHLAQEL